MGLTDSIVRRAAGPARLGLRAGETAIGAAIDLVRGARSVLGHDDGERDRGATTPATRAPASGPELVRDEPGETTVPPHGDAVAPARAPHAPAATPAAPAGESRLEGLPAVEPQGDSMPVAPPPSGAKRVDDEAVAVGEFGEPGAEEDAGAEVHVDPPWEHYDDMTAAQVADRLRAADRALAAAVALYESSRRGRKSVARAAEARLRALDAPPGGG